MSSVQTTRYKRNPLYVDAVQVTTQNFAEVAKWCDGVIANMNGMPVERDVAGGLVIRPMGQYIGVRVHAPKNIRQTQAYIGDWILATDRGFKVYTDTAFNASWSKVDA
jgi:hypothetical protein